MISFHQNLIVVIIFGKEHWVKVMVFLNLFNELREKKINLILCFEQPNKNILQIHDLEL